MLVFIINFLLYAASVGTYSSYRVRLYRRSFAKFGLLTLPITQVEATAIQFIPEVCSPYSNCILVYWGTFRHTCMLHSSASAQFDYKLTTHRLTCARGTRRRPCPTHRIFGACYWSLRQTSPAVLTLRYAACVSLSVGLQQSVSSSRLGAAVVGISEISWWD